jgi:hypothetical protein
VAHTAPALLGAWSAIPHHPVEARVGAPPGDLLDLLTPFAVLGSAGLVLASLRARGWTLALAACAAVLYVDGHGMHLAANSIAADENLPHEAANRAYFFDERLGHIEWHLGWIGLIGALCLADRARPLPLETRVQAAIALVLGFTLFTSTVEGGTWWLELGAAGFFAAWGALDRRPLLVTTAAAFAAGAVLIGAWAAWQGGVPEFSEAGLI